jgi:hypothetical protein
MKIGQLGFVVCALVLVLHPIPSFGEEPESSFEKPTLVSLDAGEPGDRGQLIHQEQKVVIESMYWASVGKKCSIMDITSYPMSLDDEISKIAYANNANPRSKDECEGMSGPVGPKLGKLLPSGSEVVVLTTKGPITLKVKGVSAFAGASSNHLIVIMDGNRKLAGLEGLAVINTIMPKALKLKAVAKPSRRDLRFLGKVRDEIAAGLSKEVATILKRVRVSAKTMSMMKGKFPGGGAALISIHAAQLGEVEGMDLLSGLVLVDSSGKVVQYINAPTVQIEHFEFLYLVDLDNNGVDEVVVKMSYYEGDYTYLLQWKNGQPVFEQVAGDGA